MELLKKLTLCTAPSGRESELRRIIKQEMADICDEIRTDALGNLICHKSGSGKKIMLAAHMDEIGIIVTFIDKDGFLRFSNVGGVKNFNCINRSIVFENGTRGIISYENKEKAPDIDIDKMYIDIGAESFDEASKKVSVGDMAVFCGEFSVIGNKITSKALDDRVGCYALINAMKRARDFQNDIYAVFTAQEEVGLRGAKTAAFSINPDIGIAIDVSGTGDTPKSEEINLCQGKGPGIKIKDASFLINEAVRTLLLECAKENNIPYQIHAVRSGGTDAGSILLSSKGAAVGTVSIPCRYIHSPHETVDILDIENTTELIKCIIERRLK